VGEDGGEVFLKSLVLKMMKCSAIAVVSLFAIFSITEFAAQQSNSGMSGPSKNPIKDPKEMYPRLRNMMLQGSREKFSLPATSKRTEPWGIVMDWGVENGTATVVAMSDGSASVYFSSGGGWMGGKGIEPVRLAAQKAVEIARVVELPRDPTTNYPLPETHGVYFYFLTDAGVFICRTTEQDLNSRSHPLRQTGDAMQQVISQFRLWKHRRFVEETKMREWVGVLRLRKCFTS
jgi:hypothetical protein